MDLLRRLYFNLRYSRKPPWDTGVSPPELIRYIQGHPSGRAIDMGCGTGTNVITLAENGWEVTGVDFAWRAIRLAHRKARLAGVRVNLHVDDVSALHHIQGPFDLILDIGCFHNLSSEIRPGYLHNLQRLLAAEGTYLLYAFLKEHEDNSRPGVSESDLDQMAKSLKLIDRRDGNDRNKRSSAWLTFCQL